MPIIPIHLEVEDVAAGPIMLLLARTPGVIKMNMILDHKSSGTPATPRIAGGPNIEQTVLALLLKHDDPIHVSIIAQHVGGKTRAYGSLHALKKKGVAKNVDTGTWTLTDKARRDLGGQKLLPPPNGHEVEKTADGRVVRGAAINIMLKALSAQALRPIEIAAALDAHGASGKAISGVLYRGQRDGLVKKNASGQYELTPKGVKQASVTATAAGT